MEYMVQKSMYLLVCTLVSGVLDSKHLFFKMLVQTVYHLANFLAISMAQYQTG